MISIHRILYLSIKLLNFDKTNSATISLNRFIFFHFFSIIAYALLLSFKFFKIHDIDFVDE